MPLRSSAVTLAFLAAFIRPALAQVPDQAALQSLWAEQQKDPANHSALAQDAGAFEQHFSASPLIPVARGFEAWHLLEAGDLDKGRALLERMLAGGSQPVAAAGAEMARHWLTRLDREKVVAALQKAYAEDLEYPETLDSIAALPQEARPPMTDRWGQGWLYTPGAFKTLQTGDRQTFELESKSLGANSDLKDALALPYGAGFTFHPTRVMPSVGGKAVIVFQDAAGKSAALSEGSFGGSLGFVFQGDTMLILSSGDYWSIQDKPSS